eukprot:TRINITY_DN1040_c0_g4_i1.p1 TRINITY_DN1040_c0_g4~~TRINITY_DN1040_c0_g4_i1.p1  ORF type:complete len:1457 (-),score=346.27 TRINITY_DN1040_c0_g4_i1:66-4436(-)
MKSSVFKVFPGPPHEANKFCIHWSSTNLIAYGCQNYVVILDPVSLNRIQTLDAHPSPVVKVKWCNRDMTLANFVSAKTETYPLLLASGDTLGNIFIWDVQQASIIASLNDEKGKQLGPLQDLAWHPTHHHLLVSIHKKSTLVMWNVETKQKLWEVPFKDPIQSLRFNPFDPQHICVSTDLGWIYFVRDYNEDLPPRLIDLKYRLVSPANPDAPEKSEKVEFQETVFSPHTRNIIYFILKRKILVFDITIHQPVGTILLERNRSSFVQMLSLKEDSNTIFCLHEDGSVSAWHKLPSSFKYELQSVLDLVLFNIQGRKLGLSIYGMSNGVNRQENVISALRSDGTIFMVRYHERIVKTIVSSSGDGIIRKRRSSTPAALKPLPSSPLKTAKTSKSLNISRSNVVTPVISLSSIPSSQYHPTLSNQPKTINESTYSTESANVSQPEVIAEIVRPGRLVIVGNLSALSHPISSLSSCQFEGHYHYVAVGNHSGCIQILDVKRSKIIMEFRSPHILAVRGLRWLDLCHVIFFCVDQNSEKGKFKNYVCILNTETGRFKYIRQKNEAESTYIRGIRPSTRGKYCIILLKDVPFQIWDLESGSLLKSIKFFQQITSMTWSPAITVPSSSSSGSSNNSTPVKSTHSQLSSSQSFNIRESFLFTTPDGVAHYYHIENNAITGPVPLNAQLAMGVIQGLAWQNQFLVSGDNSGTIYIWNFDRKRVTGFPTPEQRGHIKRIQFCPSPSTYENREENIVPVRGPPQLPTFTPTKSLSMSASTSMSAMPTTSTSSLSRLSLSSIIGSSTSESSGVKRTSSTSMLSLTPPFKRSKNDASTSQQTLPLANMASIRQSPTASPSTSMSSFSDIRTSGLDSLSSNNRVLVHFTSGTFGIWDVEHNIRVATSAYLTQRGLTASAVDWVSPSQPLIACIDGSLRVMDKTLSHSNCPIQPRVTRKNLHSPRLLNERDGLVLKTILLHSFPDHPKDLVVEDASEKMIKSVHPDFIRTLKQIQSRQRSSNQNDESTTPISLPSSLNRLYSLKSGDNNNNKPPTLNEKTSESYAIVEKAHEIALFYGNSWESEFWTLCKCFLLKKQHAKMMAMLNATNNTTTTTQSQSSQQTKQEEDEDEKEEEEEDNRDNNVDDGSIAVDTTVNFDDESYSSPLKNNSKVPDHYDLLLNSTRLRQIQEDRATSHLERTNSMSDYHLTKKVAELQLYLNHRDVAADLLLSTTASTSENPHYYADALMSCVIAATVDQKNFHNTVKLVATNLIAHDKLDAGVQLLCLIGKGLDACRYLQTYDKWTDAAWLARITLQEHECAIVMKKWVNYLVESGDKGNLLQAINILLTLGEYTEWNEVLELLSKRIEYVDVASLFSNIVILEEGDSISADTLKTIHSIYENYSKVLVNLGCLHTSAYYFDKLNLKSNLQKVNESINTTLSVMTDVVDDVGTNTDGDNGGLEEMEVEQSN